MKDNLKDKEIKNLTTLLIALSIILITLFVVFVFQTLKYDELEQENELLFISLETSVLVNQDLIEVICIDMAEYIVKDNNITGYEFNSACQELFEALEETKTIWGIK